MPRHIEIKARIDRVEALLPTARALAHGEAGVIEQDDTFFQVAHGRLKLRQFADGSAELIRCHRAIAEGWMQRLALQHAPRLGGAYMDMLGAAAGNTPA